MKLSKLLLGTFFATSLVFAGGHGGESKHGGNHWGYTGHSGPGNWGDLSEKFQMCKLGSSQSPIDIRYDALVKTRALEEINFSYNRGALSVVNNGHTIQVNVKEGNSISIDGIRFELKQFHFHTPSENEIQGKSFPLEAHFVHVSSGGKIAVVAVLFEEGRFNSTLKKIWKKMPYRAGTTEHLELSVAYINILLPRDKSYYRFSGSLTTPPCSEGVRWFVLKNYSRVSEQQVADFLNIMKHPNNRPIQPINARKIMN